MCTNQIKTNVREGKAHMTCNPGFMETISRDERFHIFLIYIQVANLSMAENNVVHFLS